jgi:glutamate-1-semialdehyde 2,1-aminomutase
MSTLAQLLRQAGIAAQVIGEPPLFEVVFTTDTSPIRDYQGTARGDMDKARRFNALLRERGILKGEQKYYVSLAHTADDIRHTSEAWASAIKVLVQ